MVKEIKGQPVASTHVDMHGEQLTLEHLKAIALSVPPIAPINNNHDMGLAPIGEMKKFRIIEDPNSPGDYLLVCDVKYDDEAEGIPSGGLSWSFLEGGIANSKVHEFEIYLPFPAYNDDTLIGELLSSDANLLVGKWIKKSADPLSIALIAIFAPPIWNSIYKIVFRNKVESFLQSVKDRWPKRLGINISIELPIESYSPKPVAVLIPEVSSGINSLLTAVDGLDKAMDICILDYANTGKEISRIRLSYESSEKAYKVVIIEYRSGETSTFK